MKAALPENTVEVPASGYWPFGLHIEPTPKGLLLRPARKPRAGWAKAFRTGVSDAKQDLRSGKVRRGSAADLMAELRRP